jgi:hypothetical protein
MERSSEVIFVGTIWDALRILKKMDAESLTKLEQYVLYRYLGLFIPDALKKYSFMEDGLYQKTFSALLNKIPPEAKTQL